MFCERCGALILSGGTICSQCKAVGVIRPQPQRHASKLDSGLIWGGIFWLAVLGGIGLTIADYFGACPCEAVDYITKSCALAHLHRPGCKETEDALEVDEVKDVSITDDKGKRSEMREVIYEFKKRPSAGPVTNDVMRNNQMMYKLEDGSWRIACEAGPLPKDR